MRHDVTITTHRTVERTIDVEFPLYTVERYEVDGKIVVSKFDSPDRNVSLSYFGSPEHFDTPWFRLVVADGPGLVDRVDDLPEKVRLSDRARPLFERTLRQLKTLVDRTQP